MLGNGKQKSYRHGFGKVACCRRFETLQGWENCKCHRFRNGRQVLYFLLSKEQRHQFISLDYHASNVTMALFSWGVSSLKFIFQLILVLLLNKASNTTVAQIIERTVWALSKFFHFLLLPRPRWEHRCQSHVCMVNMKVPLEVFLMFFKPVLHGLIKWDITVTFLL